MRNILLMLKKKLYLFVIADFVVALSVGYFYDLKQFNIKPVSMFAVFLMLYPMLTGIEIEKVRKAGRNIKLIVSTLFFAYIVASLTAFFVSRTILASYPQIAFAMVMVGAIPCSNMLIGWSGIADASVEDALVIAVSGLLLIPVLSPLILKLSGGVFVEFEIEHVVVLLFTYIFVPLVMGLITRTVIIRKKGQKYFMELKKIFPGVSATGILLIVFFSVSKVARMVIARPIVFILVFAGLITYYFIQTILAVMFAKIVRFRYEQGMILILGAVASSQAISLGIAATVFGPLTVFALSFKPILQVFYIMMLIYGLGPFLRKHLK